LTAPYHRAPLSIHSLYDAYTSLAHTHNRGLIPTPPPTFNYLSDADLKQNHLDEGEDDARGHSNPQTQPHSGGGRRSQVRIR
jgi:hypothetical protein